MKASNANKHALCDCGRHARHMIRLGKDGPVYYLCDHHECINRFWFGHA
jgi:hypothetical protein